MGGVRNCFGRLWRRTDVFRDDRLLDPWTLVSSLLEDNFTAILERPRIARNRALAREIARAFLLRRGLAKKLDISNPTQEFLRQLMLRVVRHGGYVALPALHHNEMATAIRDMANATLSAMGMRAPGDAELIADAPQLAIVPGWEPPAIAGDVEEAAGRGARSGSVWNKVTGLLKPSRRA
jgi:hypothetical protein